MKLHLADSARRAPAPGFGDTVRGRPGTTDVREMTPVLGDLRHGDFDFAQTRRRALILPIHPLGIRRTRTPGRSET